MIYTLTQPISPGVSPGVSPVVSPVVSPGVSPVSTVSPMSLTPGIMHLINYGDKDLGLLLSQR
jgi:hypothetical protein